MSKFVETNLPCPDQEGCGSSDAYAVDKEGRGFCFSCGNPFNNGVTMPKEDLTVDYEYVPLRGLTVGTMRFYDISTEVKNGIPCRSVFKYPHPTELTPNDARKIRSHLIPKKRKGSIKTEGNASAPNLFGMDKFAKGSKATITITEGEYDAAAVYQMLKGVTAAVSVRSASSVATDFAAHRDYINSFNRIYLCFDNDEAGQAQIAEAAKFFDFKKVYIVRMSRKDPNEYLHSEDKEPDVDTFVKEWRAAKRYTPDSIISSFAEFEEALEEDPAEMLCDFPFSQYNESLHALFAGQVMVVKGLEGIGKTEIFRAMQHHILKNYKFPIGIIHMEESNAVTLRGVATYELKQPVNDDNYVISNDKVMEAIKSACGGDSSRIMLHSSKDIEDEDLFLDSLRYMMAVGGCRVIFLDHITWLATGGMDGDERQVLDKLSQDIKKLALLYNCAVVMISHVNDDGKTRGSRNITKVADIVVNLYRNKEAESAEERNKLNSLAEKSRKQGTTTGPLGYAVYDRYTGMLEEHLPKGTPDEYV